MKRIFLVIVILACSVFVAESVLLGLRVYRGEKLARDAKPLSCKPGQVKKRILIAGDDTGVGIGAGNPAASIAGRISREFPFTEILNVSRQGATASDVLEQISSTKGDDFDLVLIQSGCQDVIRLKDLDAAKDTFSQVLHEASRKAPAVFFLGMPNAGLAPAFFPPVSWLYSRRSARLRDMLILVSRETGAEYVDLFREKKEEPFLKDTGRYFADDGMHPSGHGYALWYGDLMSQTGLRETLIGN